MATTIDYVMKVSAAQGIQSLGSVAKKSFEANKGLIKAAGAAAVMGLAIKKAVAAFKAIAVAILNATKAVIKFSQESADLVNDVNDLSTRSGIASKNIKALQFALQASGQSAGAATTILSRFPQILAQAQSGSNEASKGFKQLGINLKNNDGTLRPLNDVFEDTINKLQGMEDKNQRLIISSQIFGRQAGQLMQALGDTRGLETFQAITERFGVRTGPKASKAAADFQVSIAALDTVAKGLKSQFIETFGPDVVNLILDFGGAIVFVQSILNTFSNEIKNMFIALFSAIQTFFKTGFDLFMKFGPEILRVVPVFGGFADNIRLLSEGIDIFGVSIGDITDIKLPKLKDGLNRASADVQQFKKITKGLLATPSAGGGGAGGAGGAGEGLSIASGASFEQGLTTTFDNQTQKVFLDLKSQMSELGNALIGVPTFIESSIKNVFRSAVAMTITDAVARGISGPSGLISVAGSFFGPVGDTIAGALKGIAGLGEKTPKEIEQEFKMFAKALGKGLTMLPGLLIRVIPQFAFQLGVEIIKGLIKLPRMIFEAIADLFAPIVEFFRDRKSKREERQEGRLERRAERRSNRPLLSALFDLATAGPAMGNFMSGGIMQAQSGMKFTGAKRGLAMLHEGEAVIPASGRAGQAEQRFMNGSSGGGINIVINSAVVENRAIDELVRKLENRFGNFGVGKSSLFGR